MNIKNSVLDYIRYKQVKSYGHLRWMNEWRKAKSQNLGIKSSWKKKKKRKTLKLVDAESNKWNDRKGINDMEWIGREGWRSKRKF